jgi:hypothetical protein
MWGQPPSAIQLLPCHAERSSEESEAILAAKSKHPYPLAHWPDSGDFDFLVMNSAPK